jgi:hypothetical protein
MNTLDALTDPKIGTFQDGLAEILGRDMWGREMYTGAVEFAKGVAPETLKATGDWWKE